MKCQQFEDIINVGIHTAYIARVIPRMINDSCASSDIIKWDPKKYLNIRINLHTDDQIFTIVNYQKANIHPYIFAEKFQSILTHS